MTPLNRRRFLALAAVCAGGAAVPWWFSRPPSGTAEGASTDEQPVIWEGIALGAGAQIRLYRTDGRLAESVIQKALAEVERLEKIFSLYRDDSDLSRLNREGRLNQPSADLLAVLSLSRHLHRLTGGAFDPSIQPLWHVYADHFRRHPDTDQAPPAAAIRQALDKVDNPIWFNEISEEYYHLMVIAVDKKFKGKGIFRKLISPLLKDCDKKKIPILIETHNKKI